MSCFSSSPGKVDLVEFKAVELKAIREYIARLLNDSSQRRTPSSRMSWLWHDEDELLRYQPELLHGFHERYVPSIFDVYTLHMNRLDCFLFKVLVLLPFRCVFLN